jgi:hypothetical protein
MRTRSQSSRHPDNAAPMADACSNSTKTPSPHESNTCPILNLPPEITLMIAQHLTSNGRVGIFGQERVSELFALSLTHTILRKACIATGMYTAVKPSGPLADVCSTAVDPRSNISLVSWNFPKLASPPVQVLVVDLANRDVWDSCAGLLRECRELKELRFAGSPTRTTKRLLLEDSAFRQACTQFSGDTFSLKNVHFTSTTIPVLDLVPRSRISSLVVHCSSLDIPQPPLSPPASAFWPALERVSYTGCHAIGIESSAVNALLTLFFSQPIKHFEVSVGCELGGQMVRNSHWFRCCCHILDLLERYSRSSLETYLERDEVSDTFDQPEFWNTWEPNAPTQLSRLRLMLFRRSVLQSDNYVEAG